MNIIYIRPTMKPGLFRLLLLPFLAAGISCSGGDAAKDNWGEQQVSFFSIRCPQPCVVVGSKTVSDSAYTSPFSSGTIRFGKISLEYSSLEVKGNDYNPCPCRDHTFLHASKYTIENQKVNNLQSRIAYVDEGNTYLAELCCSNSRFDKQVYLLADSLDAAQLPVVLEIFKTIHFPEDR